MARIVIYVAGGVIQSIDSEMDDLEVLVLDSDYSDPTDHRVQRFDRGDGQGSFSAYVAPITPNDNSHAVNVIWEQAAL